MNKIITYLGWFVFALIVAGFFFGAGSGDHLEQGSLMNPLEAGYGAGVEIPRVADNIRRVYLDGTFDVDDDSDDTASEFDSGSGSGSGSERSNSGSRTNPTTSSSPSNGSSLDGRSNTPLPWQRGGALNPCNGPYDINCDGSVNDADAELARQFQPSGQGGNN